MREMGFFDQLLKNTIQRRYSTQNTTRFSHTMMGNQTQVKRKRNFKIVTLYDMTSLFMFWIFGMCFSIGLFGAELFFDYFFRDWIHGLIYMDHDHKLIWFDEQHHLHFNVHFDLHLHHEHHGHHEEPHKKERNRHAPETFRSRHVFHGIACPGTNPAARHTR